MVREGRDLREIAGIGQAISNKITELVTTGKLLFYEKLKSEFPNGILGVMHVPGVGPKTTKRLWEELDVSTVSQLEQAIMDGRFATLPRLGKKKAESILHEIQSAQS